MRLVALPLLLAVPALGQASFEGLGFLSSSYSYSEGGGVSGDGSVAVGGSITGGSGINLLDSAFASSEAGLTWLYSGDFSAHAMGASYSGQTIVGYADHGAFSPQGVQAFIWTAATGPVEIGDLPGGANGVPHSFARAISDDGSRVACIGQSDNGDESFVYDVASATMTPLGDLPGGTFGSYAYGISRDGSTVVGISYSGNGQEAFRWTAAGMVPLGFLPTLASQTRFSEANAANQDGSVIVGESASANTEGNGYEAFRWSSGVMQPLGDLPGAAFQSWAYAVSADGEVVVGRGSIPGSCGPFGCGSAGRAFIWDPAHGMQDLQQLLISRGASLAGWSLTEARAISADGMTIVGTGTDPLGHTQAWRAFVPRCGSADFNHDGDTATDADIEAFFRCIAGDCCATCGTADFNADGDVAGDADIEAFFRVLAGGNC